MKVKERKKGGKIKEVTETYFKNHTTQFEIYVEPKRKPKKEEEEKEEKKKDKE